MLTRSESYDGMAIDAPGPVSRENLVHRLFAVQAARSPGAIALECAGRRVSYRELDALASSLADRLRSLGSGLNSRVAICVPRSIEMIGAVLAILKTGGGYVALDPTYPADRLAYILGNSQPSVLVTHSSLRSLLPAGSAPVLCVDEPASTPSLSSPPPATGGSPELAYLLYTSGSTGQPKGVFMPHGPLANLLHWHRRSLPLAPGERIVQFAPLSFDVSFQEIFTTLAEGGTLVLIDDHLRRDPEGLLACLADGKIHRLFLPFVALQQLAEAAVSTNRFPTGLKDIITAGEQLQVTEAIRTLFLRLPGVRLHNHYGPTETHVVTAYTLPEDPASWPTLPSIGFPIDDTVIHLLDAGRNPVPAGEPGELHISGAAVARGYWRRDDLTAERFLNDPLRPGQRMYRTGDLGRLNADGSIEFLGRADSQVKIRGHRVELGEVEAALRQHPQVQDCAVAVHPHGHDKMLVAYVIARPATAPAPGELRTFLLSTLPEPMVPAVFVSLAKLPLTPSGKLDRRALPAPERAPVPDAPRPVYASPLEEVIATAWEQVLGRTGIAGTDSFFDIGGTSVMMARVQRRLRADLGREIPITLLFQHHTIQQLAAQLGGDAPKTGSPARGASDRAALQREALARRQAQVRSKPR